MIDIPHDFDFMPVVQPPDSLKNKEEITNVGINYSLLRIMRSQNLNHITLISHLDFLKKKACITNKMGAVLLLEQNEDGPGCVEPRAEHRNAGCVER